MEKPFRKHQEANLNIEDIAFGGAGIARYDNYIIFIKKGLPGQKVKARIVKVKANYAEAQILEILEQSPFYQEALCPYCEYCGGCTFQNLAYDTQLKYLHAQVQQIYEHLGGFNTVDVLPVIRADTIFRYRNKMEFAFANRRWLLTNDDLRRPADFALGLRIPDNYYKAIDIDDCLIAPPETAVIMPLVRNFAREHHLKPYNSKSHTGYLRHLVIRKGIMTGQIMINIVTAEDTPELLRQLANLLIEQIPNVQSVINTISHNVSGTTRGERTHLLNGQDFIIEKLGELTLKISPESFCQTNTRMANRLYEVIRQLTRPEPQQVLWDLYCGAGSIALFLAKSYRSVIGLEIVAESVADARENARMNKIANATFLTVDLAKQIRTEPDVLHQLPAPDTLIVDPPRGGLNSHLIRKMLELRPSRIIYVSCNPASQVRDLKELTTDNEYRITTVQPLDLFPHTPHIEVVTALERTQ
jgi:23S rRNA (uracil1939-C5)-methyltransferase